MYCKVAPIEMLLDIGDDVNVGSDIDLALSGKRPVPKSILTKFHITMTSYWARERLKSPASRLFTQTFIQMQIKENIKAPCHWPVTRKMFPFDDVIIPPIAQIGPLSFQAAIEHKPIQVRWGGLHAPVVTEWWPACLHKRSPRVHQRGN